MRILIDCRYVRFPRHDGISRYTSRIVGALAPLASEAGHELEMLISDERQLEMLPDLPWRMGSEPTSPRELSIATRINAFEPDVLFSPMQTIGAKGRQYGLVLTLHDLIYYRNRTPPRNLPWYVRLAWRLYHLAWWPQRMLLNRADAVATVSATTRELMKQHRLTDRSITIVSNAADPVASTRARRQPKTRDVLYMGSFMPYKNVETIARALHELPGYRLHLLSRITDADRDRISALAPEGALVIHDGVSDDEYEALLDKAFALATMSLDEGFGLPLVEAMVRGTPIVVSDIPIFREIGGSAAVYASPTDVRSVAEALRSLDDPAEWARRSKSARAQATKFDWNRSARALLALLERVARENAATRAEKELAEKERSERKRTKQQNPDVS
ncbi:MULTISPECIES: glycosyltransferase family 1 protein [unclassified Salinibacterium]|uniref:glycosyltransferase family 4 protein n=1 Tax=unclassified Salinibacterium TaxID=2632331 RepID=UPI0014213374|nr:MULTISPECIES: glycosyltransferase family 1 protein [unclassified Salinibacterium]